MGSVEDFDMLKTFNCGRGMLLVIDPGLESEILESLAFWAPLDLGRVVSKKGEKQVCFVS